MKSVLEYKNELLALRSVMTYPVDPVANPVQVQASGAVALKNVTVGALMTFSTAYIRGEKETASSVLWNSKVGFSQPTWQAVLFNTNTLLSSIVGTTFFQEVTPNVHFATTFSNDRLASNSAPSASFAGLYQYATDTAMKAKISVSPQKSARLGLSLRQQWTSATIVTLSADINALQLLGTNKGAPHSFGLEVALR